MSLRRYKEPEGGEPNGLRRLRREEKKEEEKEEEVNFEYRKGEKWW